MKTEKYILSALCVGACLWSAKIIIGVIGMARDQGAPPWFAWGEVAAFVGAGLIPLLLVWQRDVKASSLLIGLWALCTAYVTLLALNALRLGLFTTGTLRLALWATIAVLLIRALRRPRAST